MKIIYSNLSNVKNFSIQNYHLLKLSNFLAQQHGYKTIFYGDSESLNSFRSISFDERYEFEDMRFKEIPKEIWSIGKFFAILNMNEPFLHVDNDILLFKNIKQDILNNNIIYLHDEFHMDLEMEKYQSHFNMQISKSKNFIDRSYNCGIIGGQNFNIIKTVCNEILEFILENKKEINNFFDTKTSKEYPSFMPAVLIEQSWIFKLFQYYKENFTPILRGKTLDEIDKDGYVQNISHLQGEKNDSFLQKVINNYINYLNIK